MKELRIIDQALEQPVGEPLRNAHQPLKKPCSDLRFTQDQAATGALAGAAVTPEDAAPFFTGWGTRRMQSSST